jgi:Fe-S-cluster-containing hydrogenase component 2
MPKKSIAVDYHQCDPKACPDGICQATLLCERKVIYQENPYDLPDTKSNMCLGCSLCLTACPKEALRML